MSIVKSYSFPDGDIRGDMFYIKHASKNFTVIDCYLKDGDGNNARKDEIIKEIVTESDGRICRFISTHPDNDHIAGIEHLDSRWGITNFYAVNNKRPTDNNDDSLTCYHRLLASKNFPIKRGIKRAWLNETNDKNGSSGINFLWPDLENRKFKEALELVSHGEKINNICPIFTYSLENGPTYMWMGDLETEMQQAFYEQFKADIPRIDILFQPHHGRKSGAVPPDLLEALDPKLIVIGNAPSEHIEYGDSRHTITQNTAGDIFFENNGKEVHVYTKNKINNRPTCLISKPGKTNITKTGYQYLVDWYYVGTLTI